MIKNDRDAAAKVAELFADAVDILAAWPSAVVDDRAWKQLLIYAPYRVGEHK